MRFSWLALFFAYSSDSSFLSKELQALCNIVWLWPAFSTALLHSLHTPSWQRYYSMSIAWTSTSSKCSFRDTSKPPLLHRRYKFFPPQSWSSLWLIHITQHYHTVLPVLVYEVIVALNSIKAKWKQERRKDTSEFDFEPRDLLFGSEAEEISQTSPPPFP